MLVAGPNGSLMMPPGFVKISGGLCKIGGSCITLAIGRGNASVITGIKPVFVPRIGEIGSRTGGRTPGCLGSPSMGRTALGNSVSTIFDIVRSTLVSGRTIFVGK